MKESPLSLARVRKLLAAAASARVLVVGDVMLDQFIWGRVGRISPEAPVPVVEFERESFMPGGAANVARNLSALNVHTELFAIVGRDEGAQRLKHLLAEQAVDCQGLLSQSHRLTSIKTRIVAHQQQIVRLDRETRLDLDGPTTRRLLEAMKSRIDSADAVIVCDYGKGFVTQQLVDVLKQICRARGVWLSFDPKPTHQLNLSGLSLITPNRKEAFELATVRDGLHSGNPLEDADLLCAADVLLNELSPALLLVTLGDQGMLLCQRNHRPFHIPTVAQEVFDVSGAGDTVIASFTLAVVAGASPLEAAIFSNHAAGVVVGKVGTATVTRQELLASFGAR
ncbi:MAG TPA: D-glycero-beta-D-manno-heptose-7-phosphate kinase [Candidatus Eisenbacteria bacterium]|jgi:D-beta-D-heptose 7-phosphate kinase/D-beta-D-heptose 1-phosphate adenosyltransferase|nr:D-glycero-beta-D-manno-heptose-7-phosphate kinase [Candidatus Eisenbacteria bacterium]